MISTSAKDGLTPIIEATRRSDVSLRHEPWVGRAFNDAPIKVYLLGDSHYETDENFGPDVTHAVVLDHGIDQQVRLRFLTGCMSLLSGLPASQVDRAKFWHSVAFSNLSISQARGSRMPADWEGYSQGAKLMPAVLELVRPTFVVTLGDRVWSALENESVLRGSECVGGNYWRGEIAGHPVFHSMHPSGAFSWLKWSAKLSAFLKDQGFARDKVEAFVAGVVEVPQSALLRAF